jgi:hypothetical protein
MDGWRWKWNAHSDDGHSVELRGHMLPCALRTCLTAFVIELIAPAPTSALASMQRLS